MTLPPHASGGTCSSRAAAPAAVKCVCLFNNSGKSSMVELTGARAQQQQHMCSQSTNQHNCITL
jgi:hypothetical protein